MKHAYLGWIDREGLKGFQPETESVDRFLNMVTQRYAYHTVLSTTKAQGFHVTEEAKAEDGSIRLVVQRWSA